MYFCRLSPSFVILTHEPKFLKITGLGHKANLKTYGFIVCSLSIIIHISKLWETSGGFILSENNVGKRLCFMCQIQIFKGGNCIVIIQGGTVIRYSEGVSIRYSERASIRYKGLRIFRKTGGYKVQLNFSAMFFDFFPFNSTLISDMIG